VGQSHQPTRARTSRGRSSGVVGGRDQKGRDGSSGIWATEALYKDMVYVPRTRSLLGIDSSTGRSFGEGFLASCWGSAVVATTR